MADESSSRSEQASASSKEYPILLKTNFETKLCVVISPETTIGDLRKQVEIEHCNAFPDMGEIFVGAIQVHSLDSFYRLSDFTLVRKACNNGDGFPYLQVEATIINQHNQPQTGYTGGTSLLIEHNVHQEDTIIAVSPKKSAGGEEYGYLAIGKKMHKKKKEKGSLNELSTESTETIKDCVYRSEMQDNKSAKKKQQKKKAKEKTSVKLDASLEKTPEEKAGNSEHKFEKCAKLMPALSLSLRETESAHAAVVEIDNECQDHCQDVCQHISKINPKQSKRHHTVLEENTNIQATGQEFADPGTCLEGISKVPTNRSTPNNNNKLAKQSKKSKKKESTKTKSLVSSPQIPTEVVHEDVHQDEVGGTITKATHKKKRQSDHMDVHPKANYKKKRQSDPEATVTKTITALPQNVCSGTEKSMKKPVKTSKKSKKKKSTKTKSLVSSPQIPTEVVHGDVHQNEVGGTIIKATYKKKQQSVPVDVHPKATYKKKQQSDLEATVTETITALPQNMTFGTDVIGTSKKQRRNAELQSGKSANIKGVHASPAKNTSADVGGGAVGPQNEDVVDINVKDTSRPSGSSKTEWSIHPSIDPNLVKDNARRAKSSDPGWNYACWPNIADRYSVQCLLCGHISKGGIKRLKNHLIGGFPDVSKCPKTTNEIREEMIKWNQDKIKK